MKTNDPALAEVYRGYEIMSEGTQFTVKLCFDELHVKSNARDSGTLERCRQLIDERWKELEEYAKLLTEYHATAVDFEDKGKQAVQIAIKSGQILNKVKDSLPHGSWLQWLADNCNSISQDTAERYMKLAKSAHVRKVQDATSLRQAYIGVGAIKVKPKGKDPGEDDSKPENIRDTKDEDIEAWCPIGKAVKKLLNELEGCGEQDVCNAMAKLQPVIQWYEDHKLEAQLQEDANELEEAFATVLTE